MIPSLGPGHAWVFRAIEDEAPGRRAEPPARRNGRVDPSFQRELCLIDMPMSATVPLSLSRYCFRSSSLLNLT